MTWVGHGDFAETAFIQKCSRNIWEGNIQTDISEKWREGVDWICMTEQIGPSCKVSKLKLCQ
jgi:hypothetical protein